MHSGTRRLLPLLMGLALIVPAAAPVSAADDPAAAETYMLQSINAHRVRHGLIQLRLDTRMAAIARERSDYQASRDIGSHEHSGGRTVFDLIEEANITWYAAGEIIAQNRYYPSVSASADVAINGWLNSPTHRSIVLSAGYNYVGFGYAMNPDSQRRYWTAVFMKGPDRTRPTATHGSTSTTATSEGVAVTFRWKGADPRLQVLTSGLRYFEIQRRWPGGTWLTWGTTTATSKRVTWPRSRTIELRVRSRDVAGNWSTWHPITVST